MQELCCASIRIKYWVISECCTVSHAHGKELLCDYCAYRDMTAELDVQIRIWKAKEPLQHLVSKFNEWQTTPSKPHLRSIGPNPTLYGGLDYNAPV